jgi:predicted metal-dependent TIM-barrel fold hydrolase
MDEERMVALVKRYGPQRILVNSAADWGISDPLKVPKTAAAMRAAGVSEADVELIFWTNPVEFFGQSGRLELAAPAAASNALYLGNSILRGQPAR